MNVVDELREEVLAARSGDEVGRIRRSRSRVFIPVESTPSGTRLSSALRTIPRGVQLVWEGELTGFDPPAPLLRLIENAMERIERTGRTESVLLAMKTVEESSQRTLTYSAFQESRSTTSGVALWDWLHGLLALDRGASGAWADLDQLLTSATHLPSRPKHSGLESVDWLHEFLGVSRDRALRIAQVPPATYYFWRNNPGQAVRPKTIAHLLRVTATLRLFEAAEGTDRARLLLTAGSPSWLDMLAEGATAAERALSDIATASRPSTFAAPDRIETVDGVLAALRSLDAEADAHPDSRPLDDPVEIPPHEAQWDTDSVE